MIWLGIDTSNTPLSVALVKDGMVLAEYNSAIALNHSLRAMPAIEELFAKAELVPADVDAIAVAEGPGSYTGVRIGVTIAKTLAWTLKKPLVGVSSLEAIAGNLFLFNGVICPLVDARRNHVYAAAYEWREGQLVPVIEDGHYAFEDFVANVRKTGRKAVFTGIDATLYETPIREAFEEQEASIAEAPFRLPRASVLVHLASAKQEADVHTFVPEYRRIAEAEANWLKEQKRGAGDGN